MSVSADEPSMGMLAVHGDASQNADMAGDPGRLDKQEKELRMNLSLGCLQAFLAVADHLDYRQAADDLGVSSKVVKDHVRQLERWLHKVLILDEPLELHEMDGLLFIPIAWDILQRFEAAGQWGKRASVQPKHSVKRKEVAKMCLRDLERFLTVSIEESYQRAAFKLNCDVATVQRSIKSLENFTGSKFFNGRPILALTDEGLAFRNLADFTVQALTEFRATIPADHDADRQLAASLHKGLKGLRSQLQGTVGLIAKSGKKQRGKVRLKDVVRQQDSVDKLDDKLIKEWGPFDRVSGTDVVIDPDVAS